MTALLGGPARPRVVAFDIIGTLFPLEPLRPWIVALGLPAVALEWWYDASGRDAVALAAAGDYRPFAAVQEAALDGVLAQAGLDPPRAGRTAVLDGMAELAVRPGTAEAVGRLADAGVAVMALSNGAARATRHLLEAAGLADRFGFVVSADEVECAKPRPEPYHRAARTAGVQPAELALVAAHPWDVQGAMRAGATGAYLSADRPYTASMPGPHVASATLPELAEALLAL